MEDLMNDLFGNVPPLDEQRFREMAEIVGENWDEMSNEQKIEHVLAATTGRIAALTVNLSETQIGEPTKMILIGKAAQDVCTPVSEYLNTLLSKSYEKGYEDGVNFSIES